MGKFTELIDQEVPVTETVPSGDYEVLVIGANAHQDKLIFLTLEVIEGDHAASSAEVRLNFPKEGHKASAQVYFNRKIHGFLTYPDVKSAFHAADSAPSAEQALQFIADVLLDKRVSARIKLVTEGDYANTNDLVSTDAPGEENA